MCFLFSSKATGSSRWISGGKGQLKGYKSHKDLQSKDGNPSSSIKARPTKARPTSGKHATQKAKDHLKPDNAKIGTKDMIEGYGTHRVNQKYSNTGHGTKKKDQQIEMDIHVDEIHPTSKQKNSGNQGILSGGQKKEGNSRRVSFDLSDEDEDDGDLVQATDAWKNGSGLHMPLHESDIGDDSAPDDRITALKAKVIAKASANIQPESVKPKVKTKQAKQTKKHTSSKTRRDRQNASTNISSHKKNIELEASGTEVQTVSKGKTKPRKEKQFVNDEPMHTHIKWEGYGDNLIDDDDEFEQKSSSQSSSDVFIVEPTANYSPADVDNRKSAVEHDPAVTAWLYSLNLLDPEKYSQIFHTHSMTMDAVAKLTEKQLKTMGVTSFVALKKLLDGVKVLRAEEKQQMKANRMTAASGASQVQAIQNVLDTKPLAKTSTAATNMNELKEGSAKKENSFSMFADLPLDFNDKSSLDMDLYVTHKSSDNLRFPDDKHEDMQPQKKQGPINLDMDLHVTGKNSDKSRLPGDRGQDAQPQKSRRPVLTSGVVNRSLASGT